MTVKMSFKKMKELQKMLGGPARGFYITEYGQCDITGKQISIDEHIAEFNRPHASANKYLVKGRPHKEYARTKRLVR